MRFINNLLLYVSFILKKGRIATTPSGRVLGVLSFSFFLFFLTGCNATQTSTFEYNQMNTTQTLKESDVVTLFSSDLCVVSTDISSSELSFDEEEAAGLFDLTSKDTVFAHRVNERMDPASMTKVMTALIALEQGGLDQRLTCKQADYITAEGAQLLSMSAGDNMTLNQALHFLLVFSANDVAVMIAEEIGGDVDTFVKMMNERAISLGATNTHFANPHGLTDEEQYTTAYDMYLIFNEAMKHEIFQQIIRLPNYKTEYKRADGTLKEVDVNSTDGYVRENSGIKAPSGITVIGGKTGNTYAAGQCLIVLVRNAAGNPYIGIYMHAPDMQTLYNKMSQLLALSSSSAN